MGFMPLNYICFVAAESAYLKSPFPEVREYLFDFNNQTFIICFLKLEKYILNCLKLFVLQRENEPWTHDSDHG